MIGKDNIEEKIFEYFEGDLSPTEAKDLENFIQANQEYQEDFDAWKNSNVESESFQFKNMNDLLANEKNSRLGWFKWGSSGAFILLLSFVSFGIYQKINSANVSKVSSVLKNHENEVLSTKVNNVNPINNVEVTTAKEIESNTRANNLKELGGNSNDAVFTSNKNINSVTNEHFIKSINHKNKAVVIKSDLTSFSEIKIDNKNGIFEKLISEFESINKPVFDYEDPNKKKEYPVLLNLENPFLHYNLAHTLEENASFAGSTDGIRGEFLYRTEWPSVTSESYESQIGSVDWQSKALKGGVGFILNRDMIGHGKLSSLSASIIYAPKFVLNGISLIPSLKYTFNSF